MTGGLDMIPKVRMCINIAREKKCPKYLIKALEAVRVDIQDKLDQRRNAAVHGVHFISDDQTKMEIETHRGRGFRERTRVTGTELRELSIDIKKVSEKYTPHLTKFITEKRKASQHIPETQSRKA